MNEHITFELIEMKRGKVSLALRRGRSSFVQVFGAWEDLSPEEAKNVQAKIEGGMIGLEELVGQPGKEVYWPLE